MKIIPPHAPTAPDDPASRVRSESIRYPLRPAWLREWLADKGEYVELACGHKENINDRSTLSILQKAFGEKQLHVFCERCDDFRHVAKSLGIREYLGIQTPENSDVPLF